MRLDIEVGKTRDSMILIIRQEKALGGTQFHRLQKSHVDKISVTYVCRCVKES